MKPGSIQHIEFEIWQTEEELFDCADRLHDLHKATDVVLRARREDAGQMLAVLRRHRALICTEMDILIRGLERYDAIRLDTLLEMRSAG